MIAVATLIAAALLATATVTGEPAPGDALDFAVSTLDVDRDDDLLLHDLDGDGRLDVLRVREGGLEVRLLAEDGTYPEAADALLDWPSDDLGWEVADGDGDGRLEVLALVEARHLEAWRFDPEGRVFVGPERWLEDTGAALPRGLRRLPLVQDVDSDGLPDVVLPRPAAYRIHLRTSPTELAEALDVACEPEVRHRTGDPSRVDGRMRQQVRVPWFDLLDVDGDGRDDLVSRSENTVLFYLAHPSLPREPTWRLDLLPGGEEQARLDIDLDDLFGNLDRRLGFKLADVDGVAPDDLVVHHDGTFRVYLGGSTRGPEGVPDQVLKSSGRVLHTLLRDVVGDEGLDLQVIRGERISLGRVVRWLVVDGSLDFDVYTYENVGGREEGVGGRPLWFSRSPARRSTVRLVIPGLLGFIDELKETGEEVRDRFKALARRADLDGTGELNDVVDLREGRLVFFRGAAERAAEPTWDPVAGLELDGLLETFILRDLDAMEDGSVRTIRLDDLEDLELSPSWLLAQATEGLEPDGAVPVDVLGVRALGVLDLDGDGREDVLVSGSLEPLPEGDDEDEDEDEDGLRRVQVFVRR